MSETSLPILTWQECNARRDQIKATNDESDFPVPFDWGTLPILDMGSSHTPGKLVTAIMARFPERIMLAGEREVQMESFEQRDINANRMTGFLWHPSKYVKDCVVGLHKKWEWSEGHIVVLAPQLLGGMTLAIDRGGEKVNAQCAALPPVECVAVLYSTPVEANHDRSCIVVLWYQTSFGLDSGFIEQIKGIDWPAHAYSYQF